MIGQCKKVGILWGGGLGDLLMIRPLLMALHRDPETKSYLLTSASHATQLFDEFCSPTEVIQLSRRIRRLLPAIKKWRGFFDLIYLGPYPTFKTRILGHLLAPKILWSKHNTGSAPFLLEQVLADINAIGLENTVEHIEFSSFLPWNVTQRSSLPSKKGPILVLHPGTKEGWTTKSWPIEKWTMLIGRVLEKTSFSLCILGSRTEKLQIDAMIESIPKPFNQRINVCLSWPLQNVIPLIAESAGVVCHNSGILHISTLLKKKTVCITGSSAEYWRPHYPWIANVTSKTCGLACNMYRCPIPFFHAKCIRKIDVDDVWERMMDHFKDEVT